MKSDEFDQDGNPVAKGPSAEGLEEQRLQAPMSMTVADVEKLWHAIDRIEKRLAALEGKK